MYKLFSKVCRFLRRKTLKFFGVIEMGSTLSAKVIRADRTIDLGIISRKKVTDAFVNYLVDSLQDSTTYPMDVFKYHDSGIGTTTENKTDTVLVTPCGDDRDEGTQGESSNIFRTQATHTYSAAFAITEHGLFSAPTDGTLADRSVFEAIDVVEGDMIVFTYRLTCNSED